MRYAYLFICHIELEFYGALVEISQNKETLYDIEVVDACIKLFREKDFKFE